MSPARMDFPFGTRLVAGDLREATGYEPGMLAMHVRGGHGTWGVARGLDASLEPGARAVRVAEGVAFDCQGAPLVLERPAVLEAPLYRDDGCGRSDSTIRGASRLLDVVIQAAGPCAPPAPSCEAAPGPVPSRLLVARVGWRRPGGDSRVGGFDSPSTRSAVPLARFRQPPSGGLVPVTGWAPPRARPLARPRIARGVVTGGGLDWLATSYGIQAWVDTAHAAFVRTPAYLLLGRSAPTEIGPFVGPFSAVGAATSRGFWLRLVFATRAPAEFGAETLRDAATDLSFAWLGVEETGCPPTPPFVGLLDVGGPTRRLATDSDFFTLFGLSS